MTLLIVLLIVNAVAHGALVARFGAGENMPFAIFTAVYVVLAVIVYLAVPYALWITLILAAIGLAGLTVTFSKPQRDKMMDRVIWVLDAAVVVYAAYLLFFAG